MTVEGEGERREGRAGLVIRMDCAAAEAVVGSSHECLKHSPAFLPLLTSDAVVDAEGTAQCPTNAMYSLQFMKGAGFLLTRGRGRMVCSSWTLQFVNRDKRRRWIDPGGCAALDEHAWIETKGPPGRVIDLGTLVHS
ncbi:hypothetical protein CC1G_05644 [Coprinopsis cinerea okayama7|uniref:Uncharacterized protein n=1 Tax=Coprinopsis cinerea (strain Okayama-7 / 130 / ATCC MYA-4618 / FGSC 9003) TaxID=240176 RepID=A8P1S1_COPC7|nr:hypothetical protein CC1G_05644 [Coprinopsis cinerea okayama7\|eukprot:XP_001838163.2 hypothetical protein CC1G_05644 [Coprinopsis cinerea okayama7\